MTATEIIQADDKKFIRVDGLTRADHSVPPAGALILLGMKTGDMMIAREGVANQYGIVFSGVELAVGLENQVVAIKHGAAAQLDRRVKVRGLWCDNTDGSGIGGMHYLSIGLIQPHYIRIHPQGTCPARR